ncbi:centrosome-associated protein 350-like [Pomacea canaliculata]|nr:centrosome-associated protein 350-like [Pomacea canaliculata]
MYQYENEVEPPAWQKPVPKRQRYYKGITPPTTVDVLLPVVQTAAISILGLNGAVGKMRGKTANKWSVRKKKDHVDAVLVKELQEEEADWISYNHDETAVKLQLTDTIFESLLADTVDAINRVQTRSSCFL